MQCRSSLHSTMYLLISSLSSLPSHQEYSFTFHYVSINIKIRNPFLSKNISFTFHYVSINIKGSGDHATLYKDFTFHYVSINIWVGVNVPLYNLDFTFHYVSINIKSRFQNLVYTATLHSTMYLLICMSTGVDNIYAFLYIPLCIY